MSKSTISTFQLFALFPAEASARTYLEALARDRGHGETGRLRLSPRLFQARETCGWYPPDAGT